jgi:uncharacterized Fe-S cluster-containing radical SAM superfamily enzyme
MTIIFLDIDGVLRTHKSDLENSIILNQEIPIRVYDRRFDSKSVNNINYIVHYTGAKIVVSSTWRNNFSVQELKEIFRERGITAEVIDKTDIGLTRGEEIREWLDRNEVTNYVVIDDQVKDIINWVDKDRVIEVNCQEGFTSDELVDKTLDILL